MCTNSQHSGKVKQVTMLLKRKLLTVALALATLSCVSCGRRTGIHYTNNRLNLSIPLPANALAQRLKEIGQPATQQGDIVTAGSHRIQVEAHVEEEIQKEDHCLLGLGVQVHLD